MIIASQIDPDIIDIGAYIICVSYSLIDYTLNILSTLPTANLWVAKFRLNYLVLLKWSVTEH